VSRVLLRGVAALLSAAELVSQLRGRGRGVLFGHVCAQLRHFNMEPELAGYVASAKADRAQAAPRASVLLLTLRKRISLLADRRRGSSVNNSRRQESATVFQTAAHYPAS